VRCVVVRAHPRDAATGSRCDPYTPVPGRGQNQSADIVMEERDHRTLAVVVQAVGRRVGPSHALVLVMLREWRQLLPPQLSLAVQVRHVLRQ